MAYCAKCGKELSNKSKFCDVCGTGVGNDNSINDSVVSIKNDPEIVRAALEGAAAMVSAQKADTQTSQTNNGGKTEPSEMDTLIGAGKLAVKYSFITAALFIGMIFLIIFGLDATFDFLAVIFVLALIYLVVKESSAKQKTPTNSSKSVSDVSVNKDVPVSKDIPASKNDPTLFDDVASPLKTLGKYVLGGIGAIIVLIAALLMSSHNGTVVGYRFWLIICAAISIYVVFKMPETSERINRNQKIATIVGIIVVSYFIFNQIDEPDNSFLGKFSNAMSSGDYETVCSMQMDSNGQFISGSEKQSCIDELQNDCGSSGCDVEASLVSSTDTGKQAEYTKNIFEYKVKVTNKAEGSHSWCEIWYVAENIDSGEQGFPRDYFITKDGEELGSGEDVAC